MPKSLFSCLIQVYYAVKYVNKTVKNYFRCKNINYSTLLSFDRKSLDL